jgi:Holliday junction DNA helicase RuvA
MISFIRGELVSVKVDRVVVDVGGVGYGIFMSEYSISNLPRVGAEVKIHTYLNVREDAMLLFGFLREEDLEIFKLLIMVNGVGPKAGLNILSTLTPDELRFAVISGDVKGISKAPGIGKKTAEKLIIELKDKMDITEILPGRDSSEPIIDGEGGNHNEAILALVSLGYGQSESFRAVKGIDTADKSTEEILKEALGKML